VPPACKNGIITSFIHFLTVRLWPNWVNLINKHYCYVESVWRRWRCYFCHQVVTVIIFHILWMRNVLPLYNNYISSFCKVLIWQEDFKWWYKRENCWVCRQNTPDQIKLFAQVKIFLDSKWRTKTYFLCNSI